MTRLRPSIVSLALAGCLALVAASGARAAAPPVLVSSPEVADYDGVTAQGLIPSVSEDGRYVGYIADDSAAGTSVFLRDMLTPAPIPVAVSSGESEELGYDADSPGLSSDGRYLAFASEDPSLSDEDVDFDRGPLGEPSSSPNRDVFVYDRVSRSISLVSRRSGVHGTAANDDSNLPAISADGRYVAFGTESRNLTPGRNIDGGVYVRDLRSSTTVLASRRSGPHGSPIRAYEPSLSGDGNLVAFVSSLRRGPHNRDNEVSIRDRRRQSTVVVSRANGERGAVGNAASEEPAIAADGRYVAFASKATNLVKGDDHRVEDVFLRDLKTDRTTLVSRAAGAHGAPGGGDSSRPAISADGRYVAFQSYANNLGPDDDGAATDVFVKDVKTGRVYLASAGAGGRAANGPSGDPGISADGHSVVFVSKATNLSPEDTDRRMSVFKYRVP